MNENTYEYACMRAELMGLEKPDKDIFLANRKEAIAKEFEDIEIEQIESGEQIGERLDRAKGGFAELGSILASTQTKINKIKGACGNLTHLLREKLGGSKGDLSYSSAPSYVEQSNAPAAPDAPAPAVVASGSKADDPKPDINSALDELDKMKEINEMSDLQFTKTVAKDVKKQADIHLNKLDALINQADKAEISMSEQRKQMKKFLR